MCLLWTHEMGLCVCSAKTTMPMDANLQKVAKVEPNVAFIIQRSTVRRAALLLAAEAWSTTTAMHADLNALLYRTRTRWCTRAK